MSAACAEDPSGGARGRSPRHGARSLVSLGVICDRQGRLDEVIDHYERALAMMERAWDPRHPGLAAPLANLGIVHFERGDHDQAIALYQRALAIERMATEVNLPRVASVLTKLGATPRRCRCSSAPLRSGRPVAWAHTSPPMAGSRSPRHCGRQTRTLARESTPSVCATRIPRCEGLTRGKLCEAHGRGGPRLPQSGTRQGHRAGGSRRPATVNCGTPGAAADWYERCSSPLGDRTDASHLRHRPSCRRARGIHRGTMEPTTPEATIRAGLPKQAELRIAGPDELRSIVETLQSHPQPQVTSLKVGEADWTPDRDFPEEPALDASQSRAFFAAFPNLEHLEIVGWALFTTFSHDHLATMRLRGCPCWDLESDGMVFPKLTQLVWTDAEDAHGLSCFENDAEGLMWALHPQRTPLLTDIEATDAYAGQLCSEALCGTPKEIERIRLRGLNAGAFDFKTRVKRLEILFGDEEELNWLKVDVAKLARDHAMEIVWVREDGTEKLLGSK